MIHKNFQPHEINEIIDVAYRKMYETWGPFLMRQLQVSLNGFEYCRASKHPALREAKAERHLHYAEGLYCFIKACERFAPNDRVRTRIRRLEHRYRQVVGEPSRSQRALSKYALAMAYLESAREAVFPRAHKPRREPTKIYEFGGNLRPLDELERPYRVKFPQRDIWFQVHRALEPLRGLLTGGIFSTGEGYSGSVLMKRGSSEAKRAA
jgi:hypothetical protein